jgi:hypothetical protein
MNNLIGISGGIKAGKDLIGEMIQYIGDCVDQHISYGDFTNGYYPSGHRPPIYEIKKCADKLKDCVCLILGCTREQLEDRDFKENVLGEEWWYYLRAKNRTPKMYPYLDGKPDFDCVLIKLTPRLLLQILGTEGGREVVHPNIWVNALFSDYKPITTKMGQNFMETTTSFPNWIITDVRFPNNEGKAVSSRDGLLIGVKRKFALRFPEYDDLIDCTVDEYETPSDLEDINPELYKNLMHESETSMGDHSWCDVIIENNGTIEELFNNVLNAVQCQKELS